MNRSKLESDIIILDDELLKEERKIITIENQLETSELTSDGDDSYFEWRVRAITAINMIRAKINSIKRQANYWRELLKKTKSESVIKLKQENVKLDKIKYWRKEEEKKNRVDRGILALEKANNTRLKKEQEKTNRHKISESIDILISKEFKKIVKEFVGKEKYIELIQRANEIVLSGSDKQKSIDDYDVDYLKSIGAI